MARSTVAVRFTGDVADLKRSIDQVEGRMKGVGGKLSGFAKKAAVPLAAAGAGLVALGNSAVNAGSDLEETLSKSNTVFGSQAKVIERWANGAAKSLGQSKQQALEAASSFGNMFDQLGIGEEQSADMSKAMTELASDFASFHNADITEVLQAQQAAFRGEYDALQRFVPTINAAAVEQKALGMTGKRTTKELTAQEKALATQALMLEGAGEAAGDFARTSDGLANKQRIQSAQWADLQAKIGRGLIPVMSALTGFITGRLIPGIEALAGWVSRNKDVLLALGAGITAALVPAFIAWAASAAAAAAATLAAAAPVIAVGAAIAALTAGIIYAYQNWDWFREAVDKVARFFTGTLWPALKSVAGWITGTLIPTIGNVIRKVGEWGTKVAEVAGAIASTISTMVSNVKSALGAAWSVLRSIIVSPFERALDGVRAAWDWILSTIRGAVRKIRSVIDSALGPVDELLGKVGSVAGAIGGGIGKIGGALGKIPGFDTGGVVPGPIGAARVAVVHGGETILPTHKRGRTTASAVAPIVVNVNGGTFLGTSQTQLKRELIAMLNEARRQGVA